MLLIPEHEIVVIQPPRTGSTALRDAVLATYPEATSLYRHMERPGIPESCAHWRVICLVRDPFERLASIYRYMANFRPTSRAEATDIWVQRMRSDVARPFADWLEESAEVFTDPVDVDGSYNPYHAVLDTTPIARKSQWAWARPDLGAVLPLHIDDAPGLRKHLGVAVGTVNPSVSADRPRPCARVQAHLETHFAWDLSIFARGIAA